MRNIFKILLTLMIFINIINADEVEKPQKLDKFDDLYYMGIGERFSACNYSFFLHLSNLF